LGQSAAELPDLRVVDVGALKPNRYVCAQGLLGAAGAIRFERLTAGGTFRVWPVIGRTDLWVVTHLAAGAEGGRYVPPTRFCGRMVPMHESGIRHRGLASAVTSLTGIVPTASAWLLVDGETPETACWGAVLAALFAAFAVWNAWVVRRMLRRVPG